MAFNQRLMVNLHLKNHGFMKNSALTTNLYIRFNHNTPNTVIEQWTMEHTTQLKVLKSLSKHSKENTYHLP